MRIPSGVGKIGSKQNEPECRQKWAGLVRIWSEFVQVQLGLLEISLMKAGIGHPFCGSRRDWSEFLQEKVGLSRIFRQGRDWTEFVHEPVRLVRIPLGPGGLV